jgi:predicted transcriptional regulator of viral defense system
MLVRRSATTSGGSSQVGNLCDIKLTINVSFMSSRASRLIAELAEGQGGHFTVEQAKHAGLSHRVLSYHTSTGDLERVAHGVYRWAQFPPHRFGDVIAAVLWAGSDAAASHETALAIYGLAAAMPPAIHLTTPRPFRGRRQGVLVHHAPLSAAEIRVFDAVQVTTPARTLVDVARTSDPSLARQAATEALEQGLLSRRRLAAAVDADPEGDRLRAVLGLGRSEAYTS